MFYIVYDLLHVKGYLFSPIGLLHQACGEGERKTFNISQTIK